MKTLTKSNYNDTQRNVADETDDVYFYFGDQFRKFQDSEPIKIQKVM